MAEYLEKEGLKKSITSVMSIEKVAPNIIQLVIDIIDSEMLADIRPVNCTEWIEHGLSRYDSRIMTRYKEDNYIP